MFIMQEVLHTEAQPREARASKQERERVANWIYLTTTQIGIQKIPGEWARAYFDY